MKKFLVVLVLCGGLVAGCDGLTTEQVREMSATVDTLNAQIEQYQPIVAQLTAQLERDGYLPAEAATTLAKVQSEIDRVQPQITALNAALGRHDGDWAKTAQELNAASAPFNPYAGYIGMVITLAGAIVGFLKASKAKRAVVEIVSGNEQMKKDITGDAVEIFITAQNAAQSVDTQVMVAGIRRELNA
jgi:outer membrane murein-binding lipoprotein Lpp